MSEIIDAYYWIDSDWAYFGAPRLASIAQRSGLQVRHRPVNMTTVYERTGGVKLELRSHERQLYRIVEMKRFSKILDMPINIEPLYNSDVELASCCVIAAQEMGHDVHQFSFSIMRAIWVEDRDVEDTDVLTDIAFTAGLDGRKIVELAQQPQTHATYRDYTNEAISRGVWGAPFYFFRDEPFWGQDRLQMLEDAILGHLKGET